MAEKTLTETTLRETVLRLVRNRIADKLDQSGFPGDDSDLTEAMTRAGPLVDSAVDELVNVAVRPVLRRLEQAALDRAEETRLAAAKAKRATETES